MKFYNTKRKYHRISLLSKHLSPSKSKSKQSNLTSDQKKSRYYRLKSCKYPTRKEHKAIKSSNKKQQNEEEAHFSKLRREAYQDLHAQLQHYNDEFIANMRFMESNPSLASTDSLCSSTNNEDTAIENLVELFQAGSVKDYSQLIEWESYKNPPTYFECQGEYGDLW